MTVTTIDGAVRSILAVNPGIINAVGSRIYPQELPLECTFPAISIFKVSNPWSRVIGSPRFQVDSWALDFLQCQQLAQAVESALVGYSGIVDGFEIIKIVPQNSLDIYEQSTKLYQIPYDFEVSYLKF